MKKFHLTFILILSILISAPTTVHSHEITAAVTSSLTRMNEKFSANPSPEKKEKKKKVKTKGFVHQYAKDGKYIVETLSGIIGKGNYFLISIDENNHKSFAIQHAFVGGNDRKIEAGAKMLLRSGSGKVYEGITDKTVSSHKYLHKEYATAGSVRPVTENLLDSDINAIYYFADDNILDDVMNTGILKIRVTNPLGKVEDFNINEYKQERIKEHLNDLFLVIENPDPKVMGKVKYQQSDEYKKSNEVPEF